MSRVLLTIIALLGTLAALAAPLENRLRNHPSPYLAMHGNDPVAWQQWGPEVFERARRENKLVYVSIGYFSCHWCHVMQRESYRNKKIARILNRDYIPVKVDRELRPALDARLIAFVERTRGYSGWPLNVFITPEGYPLLGFVYLPAKNFRLLLVNLDKQWRAKRDELKQMARRYGEGERKKLESDGPDFGRRLVNEYFGLYRAEALSLGDDMSGGFGRKNKFPQSPQLMTLLRAHEIRPRRRSARFLRLTLDQMGRMGLHDTIRGGFFRYVVDPTWEIPHFEKMLYDNAQLVEVYLYAARVFKNKRYRKLALDTLDFMLREFMVRGKGMIASLSAVDDRNVEGGYYLWRLEELKRILPARMLKIVRYAWDMQHPPQLDAGWLPVQARSLEQVARKFGISQRRARMILGQARHLLRKAQRKRRLPRDTKILAGWNGLALHSLALGYQVTRDKRYAMAAESIRHYILTRLWRKGRLWRAASGSRESGSATLEDYAYVARGLLSWSRAIGRPRDLADVRRIVTAAWRRFLTPYGWRLSERSLVRYGAEEPIIADTALPSPSALLLEAAHALAVQDKDAGRRRQVRRLLNVGRRTLISDPFWYATHILVMDRVTASHGR